MRVSTQAWNDVGFDNLQAQLSGFVNECHTVAIIPRSDEAKADAMMNHGFILDDTTNELYYTRTMNTLGSIDAKIFNQHCKGKGMLSLGGTDFDKKLLKSFAKKYRRAGDVFSILNNEKEINSPIRFITPCGDWWVMVAQHTHEHSKFEATPIGLDPFPMEVLQ